MIRHEKPKRYEFTFLDHGTVIGPTWWCQDDVPKTLPQYEVSKTGWLLAEDSKMFLVAGAKATNSDTNGSTFTGVWVIVKGAMIRKRRVPE